MGIEDNRINTEQARVPEKFIPRTVDDMMPGEHRLINASAVWYDEEKKLWLDKTCPVGITEPTHDYPSYSSVGVIRFFDGYVIETFTSKNPPHYLEEWSQEDLENDEFDLQCRAPVVAFVTTRTEFQKVQRLYEADFGNKLNGANPRSQKAKRSVRKQQTEA